MFQEKARAKINLTLEILGKRDDGYHELRSLVAFADFGDELSFTPDNNFSLTISGPFATDLVGENLIRKAADFFQARKPGTSSGHFHLKKNLPVASGIGGGSADAAAALRLLLKSTDLPHSILNPSVIAKQLGADIPVCLEQNPVLMTGIGEHLSTLENFPALPAVLINPAVPVSTGAIFRNLNARPLPSDISALNTCNERLTSQQDILLYMATHKNDLQPIAAELEPVISDVLSTLEKQSGCQIARMSGSGATCFGIFESSHKAEIASAEIQSNHPDWWIQHCKIQ
ncbi:MAG: 4-(cytidine 5'-diphospho)-2-C-methyl-D-erythritol kinase [Methyloligellaceae bacterium]